MNNVGYPVAVCDPNYLPGTIDPTAAVFYILSDGRCTTNNSVVSGGFKFGKIPQDQNGAGSGVAISDLYNYFRFQTDNQVSPSNPNGYTETTFSNNSGFLAWNNPAFLGGSAQFFITPMVTGHVGWVQLVCYNGQATLGATQVTLNITDVDSIPVPGSSALFYSTSSSIYLSSNFMSANIE
jgi:hypothetical protein